jgi:hypothetical protein
LKGSRKTLEICNPVVCIELIESIDKNEQIRFMNDLGYKLVEVIVKDHVFKKAFKSRAT